MATKNYSALFCLVFLIICVYLQPAESQSDEGKRKDHLGPWRGKLRPGLNPRPGPKPVPAADSAEQRNPSMMDAAGVFGKTERSREERIRLWKEMIRGEALNAKSNRRGLGEVNFEDGAELNRRMMSDVAGIQNYEGRRDFVDQAAADSFEAAADSAGFAAADPEGFAAAADPEGFGAADPEGFAAPEPEGFAAAAAEPDNFEAADQFNAEQDDQLASDAALCRERICAYSRATEKFETCLSDCLKLMSSG